MALAQMDALGRAKVTFLVYDDPSNRPGDPVRMKILPWAILTLADGTQYQITVPPVLQLGGDAGANLEDDISGSTALVNAQPLFFGVASGPVVVEFQRAEDRGPNVGTPYLGGGTIGGSASAQGGKDGEAPNSLHFQSDI